MISSLLAAATLASPAFSCPAEIRDEQRVLTPIEGASVSYSTGTRKLEYMSVFKGHPSGRRLLRPIREGRSNTYVWQFAPGADVWVECSYYNSAAILTFQVGSTRQCSFSKSRGGLEPSSSRCDAPAP